MSTTALKKNSSNNKLRRTGGAGARAERGNRRELGIYRSTLHNFYCFTATFAFILARLCGRGRLTNVPLQLLRQHRTPTYRKLVRKCIESNKRGVISAANTRREPPTPNTCVLQDFRESCTQMDFCINHRFLETRYN